MTLNRLFCRVLLKGDVKAGYSPRSLTSRRSNSERGDKCNLVPARALSSRKPNGGQKPLGFSFVRSTQAVVVAKSIYNQMLWLETNKVDSAL